MLSPADVCPLVFAFFCSVLPLAAPVSLSLTLPHHSQQSAADSAKANLQSAQDKVGLTMVDAEGVVASDQSEGVWGLKCGLSSARPALCECAECVQN